MTPFLDLEIDFHNTTQENLNHGAVSEPWRYQKNVASQKKGVSCFGVKRPLCLFIVKLSFKCDEKFPLTYPTLENPKIVLRFFITLF